MSSPEHVQRIQGTHTAIAKHLANAPFVTLITRKSGEHIASTGLVANALEKTGTPYHVRTADTQAEARKIINQTDEYTTTVVLPFGFEAFTEYPEDYNIPYLGTNSDTEQRDSVNSFVSDSQDTTDTESEQRTRTEDTENTESEPIVEERENDSDGTETNEQEPQSGEGEESAPDTEAEGEGPENDSGETDDSDDSGGETDASLFTDGGVFASNKINSEKGVCVVLDRREFSGPPSVDTFGVVMEFRRYVREQLMPDAELALAGYTVSSHPDVESPSLDNLPKWEYGEDLADACSEAGAEQQYGVGTATEDLADGLAHSLRIHASFSGDENEAGAFLTEFEYPIQPDRSDREALASEIALDCTETNADVSLLNQFLKPVTLPDEHDMATGNGFGDVLDSVGRVEPGLAVSYASGFQETTKEQVMETWRDVARNTHLTLEYISHAENDDGRISVDEIIEDADVDTGFVPIGLLAKLVWSYCIDSDVVAVEMEGRTAVVGGEENRVKELVDEIVVDGESVWWESGTIAVVQKLDG